MGTGQVRVQGEGRSGLNSLPLLQVTSEEAKKAMDEQFGGEDDTLPPAPGFTAPGFKYTKYSNAYMLVYIREEAWDNVRSADCASKSQKPCTA